jgi:hypothetical protein
MATRAKLKDLVRLSHVNVLVEFVPNFTGVIRTIPCYEHVRVSLHKMATRDHNIKILTQISQVKLLVGFQPNSTGVIKYHI